VSVNPPTVSVIIPAADAADSLPRAIDSIRAQDYPNIIETVVAAADEPTSAAAVNSIVIQNLTGSTPVGLNLAINASSGDILVRCDAHSVLPSGYVSRAVETLQRTGAQNVGGMQVPVGNTFWEKAIAAAMRSAIGSGDATYRLGGPEGAVETVYLGVFPRSTLLDMGGFDETFIRTQDYELNHRVIESGGVVWFDPELRVEYRPRGSLTALAKQYREYGKAKRAFVRRHSGELRWRQALPPILVVALATSLLASTFWPWFIVLPASYLISVSLGAAVTPSRERASWLAVTAALVTMHISWGLGFLTG
jgi:glycosyltransferase involved in cell wall biosynthesis